MFFFLSVFFSAVLFVKLFDTTHQWEETHAPRASDCLCCNTLVQKLHGLATTETKCKPGKHFVWSRVVLLRDVCLPSPFYPTRGVGCSLYRPFRHLQYLHSFLVVSLIQGPVNQLLVCFSGVGGRYDEQ